MTININIPAEFIAVLKLFSAYKDTRHYLNGIALEIGRKESRLFATDGHRFGCFRIVSEQLEVTEPLETIIPHELLKHIKENSRGTVEIVVTPESESKSLVTASRKVSVIFDGMVAAGNSIDGKMPDWRRLIPSKLTKESAQFNPKYIAALGKASEILHGRSASPMVAIGFNGLDAALIDLGHDCFTGILMPIRPGKDRAPITPPIWCKDSLCTSAKRGQTDGNQ